MLRNVALDGAMDGSCFALLPAAWAVVASLCRFIWKVIDDVAEKRKKSAADCFGSIQQVKARYGTTMRCL